MFTIPDSKEKYNSEIKRLVISYQCYFEETPTKDGLVFSIEFPTISLRIKFKEELALKFPFLYY
ncbi:hypothetical protein [Flavobacterium gilvum]|nr:hypothetical protein [Flavobacterium gilvum]